MSSKSKKTATAAKDVAQRPTNETLFQEELQKLMKKYGCGISASPLIGFAQDGTLRLLDTKFSIVPIPAKPAAPVQQAAAPKKK